MRLGLASDKFAEGGSTWPCELPAHELAEKTTRGQFPLLATFTGAILVSAALLFMVQPMFTKMVLPRLGGAPSVWSVAIVFFQTTLLAGYAFAHLLTRYLPGWRSVFVQLAVMLAAVTLLPLAIAVGWERPPAVGEAFWLIGLFTVSIGLPFFALARHHIHHAHRQAPHAQDEGQRRRERAGDGAEAGMAPA